MLKHARELITNLLEQEALPYIVTYFLERNYHITAQQLSKVQTNRIASREWSMVLYHKRKAEIEQEEEHIPKRLCKLLKCEWCEDDGSSGAYKKVSRNSFLRDTFSEIAQIPVLGYRHETAF